MTLSPLSRCLGGQGDSSFCGDLGKWKEILIMHGSSMCINAYLCGFQLIFMVPVMYYSTCTLYCVDQYNGSSLVYEFNDHMIYY